MGVEEEFLLFAADAPRLTPVGDDVVLEASRLSGGQFEHELKREMAELGTSPNADLTELRSELCGLRRDLADGAVAAGARLAALALCPTDEETSVTTDDRYERMQRIHGRVARLQLTCGMHVHVGVGDPGEGVRVIDRIAPWLSCIRALSANSPFFGGGDTGFASYRTILWGQWPTAGPTAPFGDLGTYQETARLLIDSGAAMDDGMLYYDARLSATYPTVEIRVADVCQDVEDAVTLASLCRGLVETAARDLLPATPARAEVLRAASWRSARYGLDDGLIDPVSGAPAPAWDVIGRLVDSIADALAWAGDTDLVEQGLDRIRLRGNGATLQRAVFAQRHSWADVIAASVVTSTGDTLAVHRAL